jgi:hypothetical protein
VRISASVEIAKRCSTKSRAARRGFQTWSRAIKEYTYMDQAPVQNVDIVKSLETTLTILNHKLKHGVTWCSATYQPVPLLVNSFRQRTEPGVDQHYRQCD